MTAPTARAEIGKMIEHYLGELAGAYGLATLGEHGASAEVANRIIHELGHRPANVLAQMVVCLLDPAARQEAARMVHSVYRRKPCPDPQVHAQLERVAAQERRLPSPVQPGLCTWCGGAL